MRGVEGVARLALLLAGALGNLIDRIRWDGLVIDFLNLGIGPLRTGVFNVADMAVTNPFDFFLEPSAEQWPFTYDPSLAEEIAPFRKLEPLGPRLKEWLSKVDRSRQRTVDFIVGLNARLQKEIGYIVRMEPGVQSCEQTLKLAKGSCRDTGWLLVQALRHLGLAARFVSGYLIQLAPDEKALDGPSGTEVDFTDLHAWCEVYLPGAGWIGFDPTSGLLAGEGHIPVACTPEPGSAAPIVTGARTPARMASRPCILAVLASWMSGVHSHSEGPRTL